MFTLGEKISILSETGVYIVLAIDSDFILVEDVHGFELKVPIQNVVKMHHFESGEVQPKDEDQSRPKFSKSSLENMPELDLHIESFDTHRFADTAHDKFTLQMNTFRRFINDNLKKKITRVRVIHGVGEGRLKSEIQHCLRGRRGYEMNDANYSPRGVGASYIDIKISSAEPL